MRSEPVDKSSLICPVSGTKGRAVGLETLHSLVEPTQRSRITAGSYGYCDAPECDVVYFAEDGSHVFIKADLIVRVGAKEIAPPRPICYCYSHTYEEVIEEVRRTGTSSVPGDIRSKLQTKGCDCIHTNPQGSCCLGTVISLVGQASKAFQKGTVSAPPPARGDCCKVAGGDHSGNSDDGDDSGGCCSIPDD